MAFNNANLTNVLTQCQYDSQTKNYMHQELSRLFQMYASLHIKPIQITIKNSTYVILELSGTIPVPYQGQVFNIPIKIDYHVGYPNYPPVLIVTPAADMVIKPSEYVTQDGRATFEVLQR